MARDSDSKYDPSKHHRKSTRLMGYDYSKGGAFFVTMVTHQQKCPFGEIREAEEVTIYSNTNTPFSAKDHSSLQRDMLGKPERSGILALRADRKVFAFLPFS